MALNKKQSAFLLNLIVYPSMFEELRSFVNNVSIFLDQQADHLKENEPHEFEDNESEAEYNNAIDLFEKSFPVHLCNSIVITLISILERELTNYCKIVANINQLTMKLSDIKGSFFQQFRNYITNVAKLPLKFDDIRSNDIKAFIEVRNSIVHKGGFIDDSHKTQILKLNERYPTLVIEGRNLRPTIPFCNQMIGLVESFLTDLTNMTMQLYK